MQRTLSIALGLGVLVLAVWLTAQGMSHWHPEHSVDAGDAGSDSSVDASAFLSDFSDASESDPLLDLPIFGAEITRKDGGIGSRMPDGTPVPPLPDGTPKQVHFGVVLVSYRGAEGAHGSALSKQDAFDKAMRLAATAKKDFHAAVREGDEGSGDDLGHIPRGTLELAPEYLLFTLPKGGVSDPIDTPRGFWIARRID